MDKKNLTLDNRNYIIHIIVTVKVLETAIEKKNQFLFYIMYLLMFMAYYSATTAPRIIIREHFISKLIVIGKMPKFIKSAHIRYLFDNDDIYNISLY